MYSCIPNRNHSAKTFWNYEGLNLKNSNVKLICNGFKKMLQYRYVFKDNLKRA